MVINLYAALRHQLMVLRRKVPGRVRLTNNDRWFFVQLYRWFPSILQVLTIIQPETRVRWHRAGFRCYWRWKSRPRAPLISLVRINPNTANLLLHTFHHRYANRANDAGGSRQLITLALRDAPTR